jgi:hypothetical protein
MTKPIQLHVGYVGITREGKRVEIKSSNVTGTYPWLATSLDTYISSGHYYHGHHISPVDIVGPWVETPVEPLVDYNDGKWHRWAGGERPVHRSSVVHATFLVDIGEPRTQSRAAHMFVWGDCASPIVAFRVTEEYVEPPKVPREYWVSNNDGFAHDSLDSVLSDMLTEKHGYIHVREVLTDD